VESKKEGGGTHVMMRVFVYTSQVERTQVFGWYWISGTGLRVAYKDGLHMKAEYTLSELLKYEKVRELTGTEKDLWVLEASRLQDVHRKAMRG